MSEDTYQENQNQLNEEECGASDQPGWIKTTVYFSDPDPYDEIEVKKSKKYAERGRFRGT